MNERTGPVVRVVGGGLAGSEAAYLLANSGISVELVDMKPKKFTPAHESGNFAELVCSNSLKSNDVWFNACGLLKEEMRMLGSLTMEAGGPFRRSRRGGACRRSGKVFRICHKKAALPSAHFRPLGGGHGPSRRK